MPTLSQNKFVRHKQKKKKIKREMVESFVFASNREGKNILGAYRFAHHRHSNGSAPCRDSKRKMKTLTAVLRHSLIQLVLSAHERIHIYIHYDAGCVFFIPLSLSLFFFVAMCTCVGEGLRCWKLMSALRPIRTTHVLPGSNKSGGKKRKKERNLYNHSICRLQ